MWGCWRGERYGVKEVRRGCVLLLGGGLCSGSGRCLFLVLPWWGFW